MRFDFRMIINSVIFRDGRMTVFFTSLALEELPFSAGQRLFAKNGFDTLLVNVSPLKAEKKPAADITIEDN